MNISKLPVTTHATPARGDLSVVNANEIPFDVKRVFWISRMPVLARRGGHAHREGHQFLIVPHGSIQIVACGPGMVKTKFNLARPEEALYVPPLHWLEITNTNAKTALVVLASNEYSEKDYIRDFAQFQEMARSV